MCYTLFTNKFVREEGGQYALFPFSLPGACYQADVSRGISADDVYHVLMRGEVIETYPDDIPHPSRLILGWRNKRPIHIVVADNTIDKEIIVITVYEPDPQQWEQDFRRRKT